MPAAVNARKWLRETIREAVAFLEPTDERELVRFKAWEFIRYVWPVFALTPKTDPRKMAMEDAFIDCLVAAIEEACADARPGLRESRIDTCLLSACVCRHRELQFGYRLHADRPECIRVGKKDGGTTRAWRAVLPDVRFELEPETESALAWPSVLTDPGGADRGLPIYVEAHALSRLNQRLEFFGQELSHEAMLYALADPSPTVREDGTLLAKVQCPGLYGDDVPVGYMAGDREGDRYVIRTFLFITMSGTPEGDRLRARLRASTFDIHEQELDDPATYRTTDLLMKPDVLAVFEECGLGHLERLSTYSTRESLETGAADRFKRYFRKALQPRRDWLTITRRLGS
jgi:hypothetical protein